MNKKKTKFIPLIVAIIILLVALLLLMTSHFLNRVKKNPPDTVGNTAGNLNNMGLFVQKDDCIYFANSFDNNCLYKMDLDEGNIKKISNVIVCNLLNGGDYLYYFQKGTSGKGGFANIAASRGYNRCNLNGKNPTSITRDIVVSGQLVGNQLYLLTVSKEGTLFYKINTDRTGKTDLATYTINPACARDGKIYYNGTKDNHYMYELNTENDVVNMIYPKSLWFPVLYGDYVYYMDVDRNYCLCRYSFSEEQEEILTKDRVDCFNVGNGYIYYQKNGTEPQLKCMRTDGTDVMVIAEGNYTHINMTSQYVYFQEFGDSYNTYHSMIGSNGYSKFAAAEEKVSTK